ncbi:MAG TPA: lipid IV(A) 3-deoxy-D-manno-octulosonic acid transferase [Woeseiaceae bacterium]|nr:lipid IV(A) 3-deoxy-D-manno-octulosonic acid transferase [Woeseiaceae bacterium]
MRFFYNLFTYVLLIPYTVYWFLRSFSNKSYRHKLQHRFGIGYPRLEASLWVHAVSVGEVVAATPLIRALRKNYPAYEVLVTTVTPTGAARVESLLGTEVSHAYIPFENPDAVYRFFAATRPKIAMIMETEIWPNLYHGCGIRNIPLVLVSARISPRSMNSYRRLLPLFRETLSHGIVIAAQSEADAERFISLGASAARTQVIGNIKFDMEIPVELAEQGRGFRRRFFASRPVWIAASTHEGEEQLVIDTHRELLKAHADLLLILVPRHPQRFDAVRQLLDKKGVTYVSRTSAVQCDSATEVFFGDTMGEVLLFYGASDIAFVAGSLVAVGGHNMLEPAALGVPIITGPHVFNAQEIADRFVAEGACRMVADAAELKNVVDALLRNPEDARQLGENGRHILETNRGALSRLMVLIEPLIES